MEENDEYSAANEKSPNKEKMLNLVWLFCVMWFRIVDLIVLNQSVTSWLILDIELILVGSQNVTPLVFAILKIQIIETLENIVNFCLAKGLRQSFVTW